MSLSVTAQDAQELRRLIPLNILSADRFEKLCADLDIQEVPRGSVLFKQGDAKNEFVYVLSGTVSLQAGGMEMETISGGAESAKFALAHQIPRKVSAIAKDRVRYIRVDSAVVNQPTDTSRGVATYEVSDLPEETTGDWVTTLLKSPIFQRLPPANLQQILSNLEEIEVEAGQQIIHQDEPGDYYYVIKKGRCQLTRKPSRLAREIKLAELKTCDTFGEDSLISDQPRNVTVTMMTKGALLRMDKAHFLKLVKEPVIATVDFAEGQRMVAKGAQWLDVRSPDSFEEGHLPGAINIPFFRLRVELASLSREHPIILVCETGQVSEAAAFLLLRNHFDAYVLKDGLGMAPREELQPGRGALPSGIAPPGLEVSSISSARGAVGQPMFESADEIRGPGLQSPSIPESAGDELQASGSEQSERWIDWRTDADAEGTDTARAQLESRLAVLEADHVKLGADLKAARQANQAKEAECQALKSEKASLEQALQAQRKIVAAQLPLQSADKESQRLIEDIARLETEKAKILASRQALERQVEELSAVVREFVERQQTEGEGGEEVQSLRTELDTVREQATTDVMAMRAQLRAAEQEIIRVKGELQSAQQELLTWEMGRGRPLSSTMSMNAKKNRIGWLRRCLYGLLATLLGGVLWAALTLGTEFGRELIRQQLANF